MISLGLGITSGRSSVPNFLRAGRSQAFIAALNEAAATGLALDFQTPQYWLRGARQGNFASGVSGATYTRTGSRAGLDAAVIYPANVPRVAAVNGLRVHGAGTNLVRASEAFNDAVWTKTDATVTADTATAPNGSLTADKLAETATTAQHVVKSNVLASGLSSGALYTYSVYLKAAERSWAILEMQGDLGGGFAWFDLANGTIGTQTNLAGATIQLVGNGWYRCSVIDTATGTGTGVTTANIIVATANNVVSYLGAAGSGILVWGAQLEQSSFASDYIPNPNTGASSSAGADLPAVPYSSPSSYTAIVEWIEPSSPTDFPRMAGVDGAGGPALFFFNAGAPTTIGSFNGTVIVSGSTGVRAAGSVQRAVCRFTPSARTLHYNGAQIGTDANAMTAFTTIYPGLGFAAGGDPLNSSILTLAIIPRDIGATQANAVSVL